MRIPMTTSERPQGRPSRRMSVTAVFALAALSLGGAAIAGAQPRRPNTDTVPKVEIYGFGQADMIPDFRRNDPLWFDVNRPTKLPSFEREFNANNNWWFSARQSRLGVTGRTPTSRGDMLARFEFDMFGVGVDAGQTTIRLRLAYGQWGKFGGGQLWTPFMDVDVFPNILEYWGPNGMIFFRNVMLFWEPIKRDDGTKFQLALERPGASGDAGLVADRVQLENIRPRFAWPDVSAGWWIGLKKRGHVKLAGIYRSIHWEQIPTDTFDLSGQANGWGGTISSVLKFRKDNTDALRLQVVYGAGIQNYFNDAPVDIGAERNFGNLRTPVGGKALPIFGAVAYLDHWWNEHFTSAIGWSMVNITNSDLQFPNAFHNGQYASTNVIWTPVKNVLLGAEFQYGYRDNFSDGFTFSDYRIQFSAKYSFSQYIGGKP